MKYDLLIRHGEVLDPAAGLNGMLDVGIAGGKIVEIGPALPEKEARRSIGANGLYVTPGLVDIHAHVFVNAHDMGGHTDQFCSHSGVTTLCDAGSAGSATFAGLRHLLDREVHKTRVRAFVNLSAIGITGTARGGELSHFPYADPEGCARTIAENPDLAIGVKLRYGPGIVWEYSTAPVKLARRTAAMAGVPMMVHITDSPIPLPDILAEMIPGDIITHCYHGRANGIMGQEKQLVLKEVVEAQRHGIIFDCAHGRNHFSFPMIEKALDQGFLPDTISTDLTFTSATKGPVWDLATTMSKLLHFGMPFDELVKRATAAPARIMGYEGTVGTLKPGADADVALIERRNGNFQMTDSDGNTVTAKERLVTRMTLKGGRVTYERVDD
jgi:dihydroorotase